MHRKKPRSQDSDSYNEGSSTSFSVLQLDRYGRKTARYFGRPKEEACRSY
jgi:hypothetical protein